jgi:DNA primase
MKKHFYPDEVIHGIQNDPEYFLVAFKRLALINKQPLYLPKQRENGNYTMLCPFHNERTPSFRLNIRTNIVKCFGCGFSGNIFTFVQKIYKVNFFQSVKITLEMNGVPHFFVDPYPNPNQLKIPFGEYGWKEQGVDILKEKIDEDMDIIYPF